MAGKNKKTELIIYFTFTHVVFLLLKVLGGAGFFFAGPIQTS
jgi:hypothetical protein